MEEMKRETEFEFVAPGEIEARSMAIITEELGDRVLDPKEAPIIKRVIHTTADFEFADSLVFSDGAADRLEAVIRNGATVVTDTEMARAGINKRKLADYGGRVECFMSHEDVAAEARKRGITRAAVSMERAAQIPGPVLFAIGNAPTALIRLYDLIAEEGFKPAGIIAVPVGFVNVVEAKEMILRLDVPHIVARGRKGGSPVAAAIMNAMLYSMSAGR